MQIAVLARPPVFGGRVKSVDDGQARGVPGVRDIFEIPLVNGTAIAVVADRYWAAKRARDLLKIEWDSSGIEHVDSAALSSQYKQLARSPGNVTLDRGDRTAIDRVRADDRILAEFEFPYLAHAPMEPPASPCATMAIAPRSGPPVRGPPSSASRSRRSSAWNRSASLTTSCPVAAPLADADRWIRILSAKARQSRSTSRELRSN
jgi:hypothetical protein